MRDAMVRRSATASSGRRSISRMLSGVRRSTNEETELSSSTHVEFSARALEIGFNDGNELSGSMGAHGAIGLDLGVLRMKERPPRPQSHSDEVLSSPSANFHA
ncbi:hypothetical protein OsI_31173 [Oryza sativa Indica Group]|uniref:Uncharacterized protein n=1 Tax=Oryza sativa subsp. indica TaxID=39946 RepID=A2Z0P7_ORYSI|nr:hypothetical protein OsI_31173 [Oryza sativa Indica Group]